MPGENIQDWSTTAANNGNADSSINWAEGQPRASVNNSGRSMMAAHAKNRNLQNGSIVTSGTANAQTFFSGLTYTSVPTGLRVLLKIGPSLTNTTAATINMDGLGDVAIKSLFGAALSGGELVAGGYFEFLYDGTNWILIHGGRSPAARIISAVGAGTYTPTPGMTSCIIECVGGGAGGGGVIGDPAFTLCGGGGGAGSYARKIATAAEIGASQATLVGAGGTGGSSTGNNGGVTSVGTLCTTNGGIGGNGTTTAAGPAGGAGGLAGTGDFSFPGQSGLHGFYLSNSGVAILVAPGQGGSSYWGQGGAGTMAGLTSIANGGAAGLWGSGGGGGCVNTNSGIGNGGAGSQGLIVITEFF